MKGNQQNKANRESEVNKKNAGSAFFYLILAAFIILAIVFVACQGKGWGKGDGDGEGDGKKDEKVENFVDEELVPTSELTPTPIPTVTPAPKQFYVEIEQDIIVYQEREYNKIQELIDEIQQELDGNEYIVIILNDEMAIENTFQDVKNTLEKEGIEWITPTPIPTPTM